MHKKLTLSIPKPCHENWDKMNPVEKGRFCSSCEKQVVDFTLMSDGEIIRYLDKQKGNTCGHFYPDQLDRQLEMPRKQGRRWKYFYQLMIPAFLFSQKAKAQMGMVAQLKITSKPSVTAPVVPIKKPAPGLPFMLRSRIVDAQTMEPVSFANVAVKLAGKNAISDSAGNFHLSIKELDVEIEVSSAGYRKAVVKYHRGEILSAVMLERDNKLLDELTIIAYPVQGNLMRTAKTTSTCTTTVSGQTISTSKDTTFSTNLFRKAFDAIAGNNNIRCYPNPVERGGSVAIDMKNVSKGQYQIVLLSMSGETLQSERISVPDKVFLFHLPVKSSIPAGTYILHIINPENKRIHHSKIVVI